MPAFGIIFFSMISSLTGVRWHLKIFYFSISISLMTNNVEHLGFLSVHWTPAFLQRALCSFPKPVFKLCCLFCYCLIFWALYIFYTLILYEMCNWRRHSPALDCLVTQLIVSFAVENFFGFMIFYLSTVGLISWTMYNLLRR